MPASATLETARQDLNSAFQRYAQARTRGDFLEAMLEFHAGLEKAFEAILQLTPEDGDVSFAEKADRVLPQYGNELRSLNVVRNAIVHKRKAVSDQEVLATTVGFAQVTNRAWRDLFGSAPPPLPASAPAISTSTNGSPPSPQATAVSKEQQTRRAATGTWQIRWWNLLAIIVLFALTPLLAGVALYLWNSGVVPVYWPILLSIIVIVMACLTVLNAWRFVRAFGALRLLGVVSALIVIASLVLIPFGDSGSGLATRAGAAFSRVLEVTYGLTIGLIPSQFAHGQGLAFSYFGHDADGVPPASVPASAASEERTNSTTLAPAASPEGSQPTLVTSPETPAPPQQLTVPVGQIVVGATVIVQTNGTPLLGRTSPGRSSEIVVRFPNGTKLTVIDGPQEADELTWWKVEGDAGSGWSAGDFLKPVVP